MSTYFTITTAVEKAIDNVTINGRSIYSEADTLTLIKSHCKYPVIVKFYKERHEDDLESLKATLDKLDTMVLHAKKVIYKETFDHYDVIMLDRAEYYEENGWFFVDLSGGDFKALSKDRTAMLAENRRVYELMSFLFKHGCEFEYAGSRAKIKIPIHHYSNRHLIRPYMGPAKFECGVYNVTKTEEIEEITF